MVIGQISFQGQRSFSSTLIQAGIPNRSGEQRISLFLRLQWILPLPEPHETVLEDILCVCRIRQHSTGNYLQLLPKPYESISQIIHRRSK